MNLSDIVCDSHELMGCCTVRDLMELCEDSTPEKLQELYTKLNTIKLVDSMKYYDTRHVQVDPEYEFRRLTKKILVDEADTMSVYELKSKVYRLMHDYGTQNRYSEYIKCIFHYLIKPDSRPEDFFEDKELIEIMSHWVSVGKKLRNE